MLRGREDHGLVRFLPASLRKTEWVPCEAPTWQVRRCWVRRRRNLVTKRRAKGKAMGFPLEEGRALYL